jgi:pilus assembly protein Flp/PilA
MSGRILKAFLSNRSGATAIEYGLIAALISIALLSGLTAFSEALNGVFMAVDTSINDAR